MRCRTRSGGFCSCRALANGRCKFHGGMSTGPRTSGGRARSLEALANGLARWRAQRLAGSKT
ncbi:MAG TPA: HGGxSTG domain-containing protein [Burkholderiales bacterium]